MYGHDGQFYEDDQSAVLTKGINSPSLETEFHFIFECPHYSKLRNSWLSKLTIPTNFHNMENSKKLHLVFNDPENVKLSSQFILDAYDMRSKAISITNL